MKLKTYVFVFTANLFIANIASAYAGIICEPMGGGGYLCDAYVQGVNPSDASYSWLGAPGISVQGFGESAYVSCHNTSGSVRVTVTDETESFTLSRRISCDSPIIIPQF